MRHFAVFDPLRALSCALPCVMLATALCLIVPARADDDASAGKGETVTVIKAMKTSFSNIVEVSGFIMPRDRAENQIRPERMGLKVSDVLAEAGDTVTAGQTLARLSLPEGGSIVVQAPVSGLVTTANATVGGIASGKGEPLFGIMAHTDYDFVGAVSTEDLPKLASNQQANVKVVGAGEIEGTVRSIGPTVDRGGQLGQVFITINNPTNRRLLLNASGRAQIKTAQSCGIAVPITAVLYGTGGTVVQVVKGDRIETQRVELGLMSGGQVEIRDGITEGDDIVARAGALLREGDLVRPITADTSVTPCNH
jgi:HlyD family secretion protein